MFLKTLSYKTPVQSNAGLDVYEHPKKDNTYLLTADVYEGAPTPITAFFSIAPKAAGFGLFIRIMYSLFSENGIISDSTTILNVDWPFLIAVLAAGTMTIGNVLAIQQNNV